MLMTRTNFTLRGHDGAVAALAGRRTFTPSIPELEFHGRTHTHTYTHTGRDARRRADGTGHGDVAPRRAEDGHRLWRIDWGESSQWRIRRRRENRARGERVRRRWRGSIRLARRAVLEPE